MVQTQVVRQRSNAVGQELEETEYAQRSEVGESVGSAAGEATLVEADAEMNQNPETAAALSHAGNDNAQSHEGQSQEKEDRMEFLRKKLNSMRVPGGPWHGLQEDHSDHSTIHCGELRMRTDENVAAGIWPIRDASVTSQGANSAVQCKKGFASKYPCNGVDLLSFMPLSEWSSQGANDVWGWTDPDTQREYALLGLKEGTAFVDVTDPGRPRNLGTLQSATTASVWHDIKVHANHAFIVSEAKNHGMQVFDLRRLRTATGPRKWSADFHYRNFKNAHNIVINEDTSRAFAVGTNTCSGGLHMMDISTPIKPWFLGCFSADGYTHDAQCVVYNGPTKQFKGREICFAYNEKKMTVVDVTDASAPVMLSRTTYNGVKYAHQGWLDEAHEYIYADDELDEAESRDKITKTYIFDVRDLKSPTLKHIHRHQTQSIDHNLYTHKGHVYMANYCAGLRIFKITNDHLLSEAAFFDTEPDCATATFQGAWSVYPFFRSGSLLVSSVERGLFVLKQATLTPTQKPTPKPTGGPPKPTPVPSPPGACTDKSKKCNKLKGKCSKFSVQKKCQKTCNTCCMDLKKKCAKLKSKCSQAKIRQICPLTCKVCSNNGSL